MTEEQNLNFCQHFAKTYIYHTGDFKLPPMEDQIKYAVAMYDKFGKDCAMFLDKYVQAMIENAKEYNGHAIYKFDGNFWNVEAVDLVAALKGETTVTIRGFGYAGCDNCGSRVDVSICGQEVKCLNEPCSSPKEAFEVIIDCPSGVLYVNDYIEPTCEIIEKVENRGGDIGSINMFYGLRKSTEVYAEYGFFYSFVGNSCPGIYNDNGTILIGSGDYDEETGESLPLGNPGTERIGGVCTDLWWTTVVDKQILEEKCREFGVDVPEDGSYDSITVKPGRYKCTSYYAANEAPGGVYLKLELI